MTTLFEIYEASNENAINNEIELNLSEVLDYAEGAMDIYLSNEEAEKIIACHNNFVENGNGSNDYFHMVESKLDEEV